MATAMWGPVLSWCLLQLLAESTDAANPAPVALDLFDRLRLREPLAHAFEALGIMGEESWRVAARLKVALLVQANVFAAPAPPAEAEPGKAAVSISEIAEPEIGTAAPENVIAEPQPLAQLVPISSPAFWQDPDVRWLTGAHESEGHSYFVKESYEELLWWLQLPALCKLAAQPAPTRSAVQEIALTVSHFAKAAAAASYRIDALLLPEPAATASPGPSSPLPALEEQEAAESEPVINPKA